MKYSREGTRHFAFQGYYEGKFQDDNCATAIERTQSGLEQDGKQERTPRIVFQKKELMDSLRGLAMLGAFFSFAGKFGDTLEMGTKKRKSKT